MSEEAKAAINGAIKALAERIAGECAKDDADIGATEEMAKQIDILAKALPEPSVV